METFDELIDQLQKLLDSSVQNWFFGAGVSFESNIPLMYDLTKRVEVLVNEEESETSKDIYKSLKEDLPTECHIEHILSHISDMIALAERSASKQCYATGVCYTKEQLHKLYTALIKFIGTTIRYGYRSENHGLGISEKIGTQEDPIVEIEHHRRFLKALFGGRANLERRSRISFFTSNYDTLIEDALGLERKLAVDGFSGGAMAYWNPNQEFETSRYGNRNHYKVHKLHGSVDWYHDEEFGLIRSRYGAKYLNNPSQILIYPQAKKYVEAQKDPFAVLLGRFRKALARTEDNILVSCGHSFGDAHINSEILAALQSPKNKTTLLIFSKEKATGLSEILNEWMSNKLICKKIFIATQHGIYNGGPERQNYSGDEINWWTFNGLTDFLLNEASL
ncbi:MAG: SIR2 family protein [Deltaproteobacteria bacterium]|nr:SIR2 family protein [Deltaproteobacteria bacterium]